MQGPEVFREPFRITRIANAINSFIEYTIVRSV